MTEIVILVTTFLVIGYDIYAAADREQKTISRVMLEAARRYPIVPFAWGVLMGHWFWSMCS